MKLLMENWKRFLNESMSDRERGRQLTSPYEVMKGQKYVVDLLDLSVIPTQHTRDRQKRHIKKPDEYGNRYGISRDNIINGVDRAAPDFLRDFANGEIENNERFLIIVSGGKQSKLPKLNIVCSLRMQPGPDILVVHTVMRKDNFETDRFGFKGRPQKEYEVSV